MDDLDDGEIRLVMLRVMGGMLAGSLTVPDAFGNEAVLFAAAYAFVRVLQLLLFWR